MTTYEITLELESGLTEQAVESMISDMLPESDVTVEEAGTSSSGHWHGSGEGQRSR